MLKTYLHNRYKLPRRLDRRCKVTDEKRETIHRMHKEGHSKRAIAISTELDRRTITNVLSPERYAEQLKAHKERRSDGRYKETPEQRKMIMREHRTYKAHAIAKELGTTVETRFLSKGRD